MRGRRRCADHACARGTTSVRTLVRWWMAVVLLAVCAPAEAGAQNPSQPVPLQIVEFSWPLPIGSVVPAGAIAVTLDRGMGFQMQFRLPADCPALAEAMSTHGIDASNPQVTTQYQAARDYCARAQVFTRGAATAPRDFVSRTSFTTLPLDLVPYAARCAAASDEALVSACGRVAARDTAVCSGGPLPAQLSVARFLLQPGTGGAGPALDCRPVRVDSLSCRMTRGRFDGRITLRNGMVRCTPGGAGGSDAVALELRDVTFRDVNGDGLMDALLSVGTPGMADFQHWTTFAVTRRTASAPLERLQFE